VGPVRNPGPLGSERRKLEWPVGERARPGGWRWHVAEAGDGLGQLECSHAGRLESSKGMPPIPSGVTGVQQANSRNGCECDSSCAFSYPFARFVCSS
jgi:hypothetical protein